MRKSDFLAVAVVLALFVSLNGSARADSVDVPNGSFESNVVTYGNQTTAHTSWTAVWGDGSYVYTRNPTTAEFPKSGGDLLAPAAGSQCLVNTTPTYHNDVALLGPFSGLTIPGKFGDGKGGLQAGVTYAMTVAVGRASNSSVFDGFSLGFVDSNAGVGALIQNSEFSSGGNPAAGTFVNFTAYINGSEFIGAQVTTQNGVATIQQDDAITPLIVLGAGAYMDNVTISVTASGGTIDGTAIHAANLMEVPEPSTLALLATGLIGLLAYVWRRRIKAA
jgi:hypothetical protein